MIEKPEGTTKWKITVCSERAPLKAGAGRGPRRRRETIRLQPERGRCRCCCSRGAAASRHENENFHQDKINLLEPTFDEASSLFLMVGATQQRLTRSPCWPQLTSARRPEMLEKCKNCNKKKSKTPRAWQHILMSRSFLRKQEAECWRRRLRSVEQNLSTFFYIATHHNKTLPSSRHDLLANWEQHSCASVEQLYLSKATIMRESWLFL